MHLAGRLRSYGISKGLDAIRGSKAVGIRYGGHPVHHERHDAGEDDSDAQALIDFWAKLTAAIIARVPGALRYEMRGGSATVSPATSIATLPRSAYDRLFSRSS